MLSCSYSLPVIAYTSLSPNENGSEALDSLHDFCRDNACGVDIFAEEISPDEMNRPLWQKILNLIDQQKISRLVVPSLFHVAGNKKETLSSVLDLLKAKGVTLQVLSDECGQGVI
jgi:DNA invertase Pin-like site-specific DNA recombinase